MKLFRWVIVGLLIYMTILLVSGTSFIFIDYVNLLIHEAGHLLLFMFGSTISFLGGTLLQLLIPVICGLVLVQQQQDWFGGGFCSWWFGENMVNVGLYMKDAPHQALPLIGGTHDWAYLFSHWQLMPHAETIGQIAIAVGFIFMFGSIIGMIFQLLSSPTKTLNYFTHN